MPVRAPGRALSSAPDGALQALHYVRSPRKPWLRALSYRKLSPVCSYENLIRHAYIRSARLGAAEGPATPCGRAFRAAAAELAPLDEARAHCCVSVANASRGAAPGSAGGHDRLHVF